MVDLRRKRKRNEFTQTTTPELNPVQASAAGVGATAANPRPAVDPDLQNRVNRATTTSKPSPKPTKAPGILKRIGGRVLPVATTVGGVNALFNNEEETNLQQRYEQDYGGLAPRVNLARRQSTDPTAVFTDFASGAISGATFGAFKPDVTQLARKGAGLVSDFFTDGRKGPDEFGDDSRNQLRRQGIQTAGERLFQQNPELGREGAFDQVRSNVANLDAMIQQSEQAKGRIRVLENELQNPGIGTNAQRQQEIAAEINSLRGSQFDFNNLSDEQKQLATDLGFPVPDPTAIPDNKPTLGLEPEVEPDRLVPPPQEAGTPVEEPALERTTPTVYRRVNEDGVVEFTQDSSAASDPSYEEVDLEGSDLKGGFAGINAQSNLDQFPGTANFKEIKGRLDSRRGSFRKQQRRARTNQMRLYDRAKTEVLSANPHLKRALKTGNANERGAASAAMNKYILQAMGIMQQGRDAFKPQDFDDTGDLILQDRNTIALDRNNIAADRNRIAEQGQLLNYGSRGLANQTAAQQKVTGEISDFGRKNLFTDEDQVDERSAGFFENFAEGAGLADVLGRSNLSAQDRNTYKRSTLFASEIMQRFNEQGVDIDPEYYAFSGSLDGGVVNPMEKLIDSITTGQLQQYGVTTNTPGIFKALFTPGLSVFDRWDDDQLNDAYIQFGDDRMNFREIANMANKAGLLDSKTRSKLQRAN